MSLFSHIFKTSNVNPFFSPSSGRRVIYTDAKINYFLSPPHQVFLLIRFLLKNLSGQAHHLFVLFLFSTLLLSFDHPTFETFTLKASCWNPAAPFKSTTTVLVNEAVLKCYLLLKKNLKKKKHQPAKHSIQTGVLDGKMYHSPPRPPGGEEENRDWVISSKKAALTSAEKLPIAAQAMWRVPPFSSSTSPISRNLISKSVSFCRTEIISSY